jgi:hypothetical protein
MSLEEAVSAVKRKLVRFGEGDSVPIGIAERLIRDTAWWLGHPKGPVQAPEHYKRVTPGPNGLQISFGANNFLVEKAILRCKKRILEELDHALASHTWICERLLRELMIYEVCGSVSNYNNEEFDIYTPQDGFMVFGTQGINVTDFIDLICNFSDLHLVCEHA